MLGDIRRSKRDGYGSRLDLLESGYSSHDVTVLVSSVVLLRR